MGVTGVCTDTIKKNIIFTHMYVKNANIAIKHNSIVC